MCCVTESVIHKHHVSKLNTARPLGSARCSPSSASFSSLFTDSCIPSSNYFRQGTLNFDKLKETYVTAINYTPICRHT